MEKTQIKEGRRDMGFKKRGFFKRLRKESWRWKFLLSAFKGKRVNLPVTLVEDVIFKIVSVLEAVVLVLGLCFFYLFCGCNF